VVGVNLRQVNKKPVICLGGTDDTVSMEGLDVGSYKEDWLDEINENTWKALTK
jgi:hypothetical protein